MSQSEVKRLQAEYAKAAKAHNERVMEQVGRQIDAAKSKESKSEKAKKSAGQ